MVPSADVGAEASVHADMEDLDTALGRRIRLRRAALSISLRELARRSDLSPSFVSQLERGLARPRITSLHRIARALETTAQALLSTGSPTQHSLVRASDRRDVDHDEDGGMVRPLIRGDRPLAALEFRGLPAEFDQYYDHPGEEMLLVAAGRVEVDLDGALMTLEIGDCLTYDGLIPHRSRSVGDDEARIYLITVREDPTAP